MYASWKDFRGKRPLANVRLRGPARTGRFQQDDDSRISHRTSLQWTPLFFTHDRDSKGVGSPLDLLPGTPYLAEEICESGCRARNK